MELLLCGINLGRVFLAVMHDCGRIGRKRSQLHIEATRLGLGVNIDYAGD